MKMMLSLVWLLIAIAHKAEPFISENFTECREFFYNQSFPQGFQNISPPHHINHPNLPDGIKAKELTSPAYICQRYKNIDYFASLYDRGRRVPLYSAYILDRRPTDKCIPGRQTRFNVEPQLVDRKLNKAMLSQSATKGEIQKHFKIKNIQEALERLRTSQAVSADYGITGYHRGHLNPVCHHKNQVAQDATFTLTNAVPMNSSLNQGQWNVYEKKMIEIARDCNTTYVVTGIVPGNNSLNDRVNIPSHVWSAYCCVDNNGKPIRSGAGLANNINYPVKVISVSELEVQLQRLIQYISFSIFQNKCS
ncbi:endonuclease domain-containing 1 protein [Xenopus tropicalis]|nr:endonuclease domain-containing 1 protein [Xenopus tropicalis]|eukprot:XP_002932761.1 PREDICTED: endonuclease domain-containing 1 protein-like [Xenopus tropicalis]